MRKSVLLLSAGAALLLGMGAAQAGTCTTEIEALQKQLSSTDAGMGPTGTGTMVPSSQSGEMTEPSTDSSSTGGGQDANHPPTATMNEAVEGKAASEEDVLNQNQTQPTDAEASSSADESSVTGTSEALASLERAKQLDQAGDETACMSEIGKAKEALQQ